MSEWTAGYTQSLRDLVALAHSRRLPPLPEPWQALIDDLIRDADVIEHEQSNVTLRRKLRARRETGHQTTLRLL
jgi:hypothetical protein